MTFTLNRLKWMRESIKLRNDLIESKVWTQITHRNTKSYNWYELRRRHTCWWIELYWTIDRLFWKIGTTDDWLRLTCIWKAKQLLTNVYCYETFRGTIGEHWAKKLTYFSIGYVDHHPCQEDSLHFICTQVILV